MKNKMKKLKQEGKKATISVSFLISMILLIMGFVVLLIFYFNMGGTGEIDRTICHESVLLRATLPSIIENYVPLKCKTNKICITSGKLNDLLPLSKGCEDFKGEKGITNVRVSNEDQIAQIYAQEMLACWETLGEGKASLFNQYAPQTFGIGSVYPTCVICTRIALDKEKVKLPNFDLSKVDVSKYMLTHKIPGKNISYFEYMANENGKVSIKDSIFEKTDIPQITINDKSKDPQQLLNIGNNIVTQITYDDSSIVKTEINKQINNYSLQSKEGAILFMQISSPTQGKSILNILKTIAGFEAATFVLAPVRTFSLNKAAVSGCTSNPLVCGILAITGVSLQQANVAYNRYVTAGYCGDVSVGTESRSGCSAVRIVNYDANDISQYCQVIEGLP
jgi:hypothetical protein